MGLRSRRWLLASSVLVLGCKGLTEDREAAPAAVSAPAPVAPAGASAEGSPASPPTASASAGNAAASEASATATKPSPPASPAEAARTAAAAPGMAELSDDSMQQQITPYELRKHVEFLAADRLAGRPTPSRELDEAAAYVRARFEELEIAESDQRFECGGPGKPGPASNVIGLLRGRDPVLAKETVLVSAHYDHVGVREIGDDPIFNGANDDATGVAAMLEIADLVAMLNVPPRRSVLFVAFCGEELGLLGSRHFAEHPVRPLADIVAHVNLEMLGRPGPADPPSAWLPGSTRSDLVAWLAAANPGPSAVRFLDGTAIGPEEGGAFDRADNYPLALKGVVAHTVAAGSIDGLYHSPDDESDTIDYDRMAVIVRALTRGVLRLAEHDGRPAWSDPP